MVYCGNFSGMRKERGEGWSPVHRTRMQPLQVMLMNTFILIILLRCHCDAGIPGLGHFLMSAFPGAITKDTLRRKSGIAGTESSNREDYSASILHDDVDCLCIDMNEVVHSSVHGQDSPTGYCYDMYRKIDRLVQRFQPRRALVLSFDGPAPFAKLQHQRAHRTADPDTCAITPGTTFMNAIDSEVYYYANSRANLLENITLFYSGPNAPGEGELKLINWINEFIVKEKPSRGDGRIVVCGGDSDLILQCMLSGVAHRLHICQECRGQKRFEGFRYLLWDVNKLVHLIINSTCSGSNETASSDRSADAQPAFPLFRRDRRTDPVRSSVPASSLVSPILFDNAARAEAAESVVGLGQRLDISMLFIFQGNDYLPKLRGSDANLIRVLSTYRKFRRCSLAVSGAGSSVVRLDRAGRCHLNFRSLERLLFELCGGVESVDMDAAENKPPCALSILHETFQKRQIPLLAMDWSDEESDQGNWTSILRFDPSLCPPGAADFEEFRAQGEGPSKRDARAQAAEAALVKFFPDSYKKLQMKRLQHEMHSGTLSGDQVNRFFEWIAEQRRVRLQKPVQASEIVANTPSEREALIGSSDSDMEYSYEEDPEPGEDQDLMAVGNEDEYDEEEGMKGVAGAGKEWAELDDIGAEAFASLRLAPSRGSASRVSSQEDVEHYLRGILWTLQMYVTGSCPDASYSYFGRPGVTVYQLWKYLNESAPAKLSKVIRVPYSKHRSLSPEAVCTAVLPLSEVVVNEMPQRLRSRWESLQSALAPDSFHAMHQLQQLYNSSANFAGNKSEDYDLAELKNWNNLVNYSSIIGSIKQYWNTPDKSKNITRTEENGPTTVTAPAPPISLFSRNHPHEPCEWTAIWTTHRPHAATRGKGARASRESGKSSATSQFSKTWPVLSLLDASSRPPTSRLSILERPVPWPFTKLPFKSKMSRLRYAPSIRSFDIRPLRYQTQSNLRANAVKSMSPKVALDSDAASRRKIAGSEAKSNRNSASKISRSLD